MKTFGIPATQQLVSLVETQPHGFDEPGYHVEQLCPPGRYHANDDRAPWNAYHNADPAYWRAEYPEAWVAVADDDPAAPWNQTEPDRDPSNYTIDNPETVPMLWIPPKLVPLVKLPKPDDTRTHTHSPELSWHEDRVERGWIARSLTVEEAEARAQSEQLARIAAIKEETDAIYSSLPMEVQAEFAAVYVSAKDFISQGKFELAAALVSAQEVTPELLEAKKSILDKIQ